jgi:hypothetical protein
VDAQKIGDMTRTDVLLEESLTALAPLIRLLLANGVTYPQFVAALKLSFRARSRGWLPVARR